MVSNNCLIILEASPIGPSLNVLNNEFVPKRSCTCIRVDTSNNFDLCIISNRTVVKDCVSCTYAYSVAESVSPGW